METKVTLLNQNIFLLSLRAFWVVFYHSIWYTCSFFGGPLCCNIRGCNFFWKSSRMLPFAGILIFNSKWIKIRLTWSLSCWILQNYSSQKWDNLCQFGLFYLIGTTIWSLGAKFINKVFRGLLSWWCYCSITINPKFWQETPFLKADLESRESQLSDDTLQWSPKFFWDFFLQLTGCAEFCFIKSSFFDK